MFPWGVSRARWRGCGGTRAPRGRPGRPSVRMPMIARRRSSRVCASSASPIASSSPSRAASRSPRSSASKASGPTSERFEIGSARRSRRRRSRLAWGSTASSASSSAPRSSRARAERNRDVGAPRLELGRLAQRELVAFASSSSARDGTQRVEERLDLRLRHRADELVDHLAVAEGLHRGNPLDAVAGREAWLESTSTLASTTLPPRPPRPPRAPGSGSGRARTTRPRNRPPPGSAASARSRRARSRFGHVDGHRGRLARSGRRLSPYRLASVKLGTLCWTDEGTRRHATARRHVCGTWPH